MIPLVILVTAPAARPASCSSWVRRGGCKQGPWTLVERLCRPLHRRAGTSHRSPAAAIAPPPKAQSYALFFALADNDRPRFDQVLKWTQANLAGGNMGSASAGLAVGQDQRTAHWKTLDPNPAADSDVWIAYSLVEAGRLWKNPAYSTLGREMMAPDRQAGSRRAARLRSHADARAHDAVFAQGDLDR